MSYLPPIAAAVFYPCPIVKAELAGLSLSQDSSKTSLERVVRTVTKDKFAAAIRRYIERPKKCGHIGGNQVEK
jgi:hypothetical protein